MIEGIASRTALAAAMARAVHQTVDGASMFHDPLATRIVGAALDGEAAAAFASAERRPVRLFIAARARIAEDAIARGVASGLDQVVVLGAGLDTFAYRNPFAPSLHVIEVDHPATQAWKHERLAEAGIAVPDGVRYAPVDFERETLLPALTAAGYDPARRGFFMWLGVVPYLTEAAIFTTLGTLAALPGGAEVVFDYADPPDTLPPDVREVHDRTATHVARLGEVLTTYFEEDTLHARLRACGFARLKDFGLPEMAARLYPGADVPAARRGAHVVWAST